MKHWAGSPRFPRDRRRPPVPLRGFSLVEALVALSLVAMAGAVMLMATDALVSTSELAYERTVADGIARQLLDEALNRRYKAPSVTAYQTDLGPNSWETSGSGRERYDDVDDFEQYQTSGVLDRWHQPLGAGDDRGDLRHPNFRIPSGLFDRWRQVVLVYYLDPLDLQSRLPDGQTSDYRAVEVIISRQDPLGGQIELARKRQVIAWPRTSER